MIPISISDDWNIITRTILPVIWQPALGPDDSAVSGLGDLQFTAFLSPAKPGEWIWGAGPIVQAPTQSNAKLGNDNWGLGPSFVVLHLDKGESLGLRRAAQQRVVADQQQAGRLATATA